MTVRSGAVVWLTGLSGAGKTTIATLVADRLRAGGSRVEHLDGDALRAALGHAGFSRPERERYLRDVGRLAARLEAEGAVVVASLISPYQSIREEIRAGCRRFLEVYVSTPIEVCERRDPKGLYAKARRGEIPHFTGIDDPYEPPTAAEVTIDAGITTAADAAVRILDRLAAMVTG